MHSSSGYVEVDGGQLFYQTYGSGYPLIVVHGGPGLDHSYLFPQMLELAKQYHLIFYDQRGSGRSLDACSEPQYLTIEQFVKDLEAVCVALKLDKYALVGHSWGGLLVLNYALNYSDYISHIILLNTLGADRQSYDAYAQEASRRVVCVQEEIAAFFSEELFCALGETEMETLYRTLFSIYFNNQKDVALLSLFQPKASAVSGYKVMQYMEYAYLAHAHYDLFPALQFLKVPTLLVHGEQDIVPVSTAQKIKDTLPYAQIVRLDECGHFCYVEKPIETFTAISEFISNYPK